MLASFRTRVTHTVSKSVTLLPRVSRMPSADVDSYVIALSSGERVRARRGNLGRRLCVYVKNRVLIINSRSRDPILTSIRRARTDPRIDTHRPASTRTEIAVVEHTQREAYK